MGAIIGLFSCQMGDVTFSLLKDFLNGLLNMSLHNIISNIK